MCSRCGNQTDCFLDAPLLFWQRMNALENLSRSENGAMSAEALIGLGITIAALGLLGVLLGWAQHMRSVPDSAILWLGTGGACVVLGVIIALTARAKKGR